MSWLFSRALVEEFSQAICLDGALSVPLSGNPIPQAYCAPDKMTVFSRLSRFGMTYKPLMEDRGAELLTLYLEAFHAKTSPSQDEAAALMESAVVCGDIWRGWLAKYDPATSSWKIAQCSLLEDLTESLATLPRSGMTRDGLLWELPMLEQIISETEYGLRPTPTVCKNYNLKSVIKTSGDELAAAVTKRMWPTPTAHNSKEGGFPSEHKRNTPTLSAQVGGTLNPMWVEWLMGWPLGWTDLKPLAMDKSLNVPL